MHIHVDVAIMASLVTARVAHGLTVLLVLLLQLLIKQL